MDKDKFVWKPGDLTFIDDEENIKKKIDTIRETKVMLDRDLAGLYEIETFNLNKAVKRNLDRFPEDFMFQLSDTEANSLVFQNGISKKTRGGSRYLPYAFTEQGVAALSRNPILIKLFRILKLAENAGYGFDKMFNGWKAHYNIEPVVENEITFYKIEFPLPEPKKDTPSKTVEKTVEKVFLAIKEKPAINAKELEVITGLTRRGVEWNLRKLKEQGKIKRVGPDKGGHWEVII